MLQLSKHAPAVVQAELSVQVRGTPTPTVSWFKDGVEVFSSRSYRVVTDNEISTLVIHQTALSDEGEIKCAATNRVGYTFSRAKLIIQGTSPYLPVNPSGILAGLYLSG